MGLDTFHVFLIILGVILGVALPCLAAACWIRRRDRMHRRRMRELYAIRHRGACAAAGACAPVSGSATSADPAAPIPVVTSDGGANSAADVSIEDGTSSEQCILYLYHGCDRSRGLAVRFGLDAPFSAVLHQLRCGDLVDLFAEDLHKSLALTATPRAVGMVVNESFTIHAGRPGSYQSLRRRHRAVVAPDPGGSDGLADAAAITSKLTGSPMETSMQSCHGSPSARFFATHSIESVGLDFKTPINCSPGTCDIAEPARHLATQLDVSQEVEMHSVSAGDAAESPLNRSEQNVVEGETSALGTPQRGSAA